MRKILMCLVSAIAFFSVTCISDVKAEAVSIPSDAVKFGNHYYKAFYDDVSWTEAKISCEQMGGYLATITSKEEQEFINNYNNSSAYLWLGGCRDDDNTIWKWITGEEWNYTNWNDGEPNNSSNVVSNENRVVLWTGGAWNDLNDNNSGESDGFICEWNFYSITTNESKYIMFPGEKNTIQCALAGEVPTEVSNTIQFKSSNTDVAKVSSKGLLVAKGVGSCTITCKAGDISKNVTVIVKPKKVTNLSVKTKSTRSVELKWKKQKNVTGYRIYMYDKDIEEYASVKTIKGKFNVGLVKKLKSKNKYKFKVRAYYKKGNVTYYGDYSKVLSVRTK